MSWGVFPFYFFLATKFFFMATISQLNVAKRRLFQTVSLEHCRYMYKPSNSLCFSIVHSEKVMQFIWTNSSSSVLTNIKYWNVFKKVVKLKVLLWRKLHLSNLSDFKENGCFMSQMSQWVMSHESMSQQVGSAVFHTVSTKCWLQTGYKNADWV